MSALRSVRLEDRQGRHTSCHAGCGGPARALGGGSPRARSRFRVSRPSSHPALLIGSAGLYGMVLGGQQLDRGAGPVGPLRFRHRGHQRFTGNRADVRTRHIRSHGLNGWTALIRLRCRRGNGTRIANLPWVGAGSRCAKVYPSTLEVDILERQAFAVWQNGQEAVG